MDVGVGVGDSERVVVGVCVLVWDAVDVSVDIDVDVSRMDGKEKDDAVTDVFVVNVLSSDIVDVDVPKNDSDGVHVKRENADDDDEDDGII